jgi:vacuolar-type H+-ATPase subunit H
MNQNAPAGNPLEALKQIRQAENRAYKVRQDAREEGSRKIIEDAHKEAGQVKDSISADARKKADHKRSHIIQEAQEQADEIRRQAREEMEALQTKAQENRAAAVRKAAEIIQKRLNGKKD